MIDEPDSGPAPHGQRRWPRSDRHDVPHPPAHEPIEPGWGDPFASYATLGDVGVDPSSRGTPDGVDVPDPWAEPVSSGGRTPRVTADVEGGAERPRTVRRPPLLLTLLRPWFDPRPGELRGAIVLLSVALVVSLALWFDASRRPQTLVAPASSVPPFDQGAGSSATPGVPGRADGSDGWGLAIESPVPRGPVVHVSGAVARPGVVMVAERARVADAIDAVGGAMPDARLDRLNLARIVEDGERIHVPRVGEDAPPPEEPASRGVLSDGRIDLNAASQAELETLPGVGPARAQAIIAERETRPFQVPGDLRRVPGIGEATFQRLAPLVAVR
jgi:comEA protein